MEYSNKTWYKRWWGILLIILLAIILFFLAACAFYIIAKIKTAEPKAGSPANNLKYDAASGDHYWLGSADAKITIVEFGDFACPACASAFATAGELRQTYKNDIKFIWRDYPVIADYSADLALAGRCAGEQGLFWPMHDKLFPNQTAIASLAGQNGADTAKLNNQLASLANQVGVKTDKFKDCLEKQKYLPQIQKDFSDGQSFGVANTPTYFINGYKIEGDVPYDTFVKIIEELKK
ncbi:MAG: thioredoxin domain-containing protein [Patescibacteria group bacterium]|nr:thioredoxin domain-containing protein [Patescibacteria group bacterium]